MIVILAFLGVFPLTVEQETQIIPLYAKIKKAVAFIDGGAGVVISPDGLLLTCNHVVAARFPTWHGYLAGGKAFEAEVLGRQVENDIALLKIKGKGPFPYLPLADPGELRVGEPVLALGNPFLLGSSSPRLLPLPPSYDPSATCGVISGLMRASRLSGGYLECDAALNPGNSGGPIVNFRGEVVGLAGRIANRFGLRVNSGAGYGPSCSVIWNFLPYLAEAKGREVLTGDIPGLVLEESSGKLYVRKKAAGGGLKLREGDQILSVGPYRVNSIESFQSSLACFPAGKTVVLWVNRNGKDLLLRVKLAGSSVEVGFLGVKLSVVPGGLKVEEVKEPAKSAGVKPGDVITAFEDNPLSSVEELALFLTLCRRGDEVKLTVERSGKSLALKVKLGAIRRSRQGKPFF